MFIYLKDEKCDEIVGQSKIFTVKEGVNTLDSKSGHLKTIRLLCTHLVCSYVYVFKSVGFNFYKGRVDV